MTNREPYSTRTPTNPGPSGFERRYRSPLVRILIAGVLLAAGHSAVPTEPNESAVAAEATQPDTIADPDASTGQISQDPLEPVVDSIRRWVPAKPIDREAPSFPKSELRKSREAWVHVTYCIDESGQTKNISILDSFGDDAFDRAAMRAVEGWRFEPALQGGSPVWQSRNETYLIFHLKRRYVGARPTFVRRYRQLNKLIDEKKYAEAAEMFDLNLANPDMSLYELGMLWVTRARLEMAGGDLYKLRMALVRATASEGSWIEDDVYEQMLELRVRVEARLGKWQEALDTYETLVEQAGGDDEKVLGLESTIASIEEQITGREILSVPAEVRRRNECAFCNDSWEFRPYRNAFTFVNVAGTLNSLEMRCDRKRFESKISPDVEWQIPAAWGQCRVQVYGEPGTTFDLVSFPDDA